MKQTLSWLILVIFTLAVEWLWGWSVILKPWLLLSASQVITGVLLLFVSYCVRSWRIYDYFSPRLQWWPTLRLTLNHNFLNNAMPARLGEISFPVLMKRYFDVAYMQSSPALLWFRLLDLHSILMIAALFWISNRAETDILTVITLAAVFIPVFIYKTKASLHAWLLSLIEKDTTGKKTTKYLTLLSGAFEHLPDNYTTFFKSLFFTWLNWLVKLLVLAWFISLFVNLPAYILVTAAVAGELTSVLPVHAPGGFGTYEAGLMTVLLPLSDDKLAASAAINTHLFLLGSSAIGFVIARLIPIKQSTSINH